MQGFCETESCCDYDFVISGLCPSYPANVKVCHNLKIQRLTDHLNSKMGNFFVPFSPPTSGKPGEGWGFCSGYVLTMLHPNVRVILTAAPHFQNQNKKMPKIDTLDALDDEMTSILTTL